MSLLHNSELKKKKSLWHVGFSGDDVWERERKNIFKMTGSWEEGGD